MNIFIPKYLRERVKIIDQLYNMIRAYYEEYSQTKEEDSFDQFRFSRRNDYVVRFLDYVIPTKYITTEVNGETITVEDKTTRETALNYLSKLFYSVKGTYKVLDYLIDYNILNADENWWNLNNLNNNKVDISYTARSIDVKVDELPDGLDRELYCDYLEKFLCALLYFEFLTINIGKMSTSMSEKTEVYLNRGQSFYQAFEINAEEVEL